MEYTSLAVPSTKSSELQTMLKPFSVLPVLAPAFPAVATDIKIIMQPPVFLEELKKKIGCAKKRIVIASLYIGHEEHELVNLLEKALKDNKDLEVHILLDCLRGTRKTQGSSSVNALLPLVKIYPDRFRLYLYHTPNLNGWLKKVVPSRFDEAVGLMHIKAYIFDNDIVLSGANLSSDYFKNRQDRYYVFNNNFSLCYYFDSLIQVISDFSYRVQYADELSEKYRLVKENGPDPVHDSAKFKAQATEKMVDFLQEIREPFSLQSFSSLDSQCDTVVFPVVQMGQLNILQDQRFTIQVLYAIDSVGRSKAGYNTKYSVAITSGYFNFTDLYQEKILQTSALFDIITASPSANGFFGSRGVSNYIPDAYTLIESDFIGRVFKSNKHITTKVKEYSRPNWTYHAKGIWLNQPGEKMPFLTSIGSPNFGYRSLERDLEAQVFLMTADSRLRHDMKEELENIRRHVTPIGGHTLYSKARSPRLFARIATPLIRSML